MHDVSKQTKVPVPAKNWPPSHWGRLDLCRGDTPGAPWHGWSFLAGSCASGWAKKHVEMEGSQYSHVTLSDLAHASSERRTARSVVRSCLHRSTLVPSLASVEFGERTRGATVPPTAALPARVPTEPSLRKELTQTARGLEIFFDFQLFGTDGSAENDISRAFVH